MGYLPLSTGEFAGFQPTINSMVLFNKKKADPTSTGSILLVHPELRKPLHHPSRPATSTRYPIDLSHAKKNSLNFHEILFV